jgi:hypothetical protein
MQQKAPITRPRPLIQDMKRRVPQKKQAKRLFFLAQLNPNKYSKKTVVIVFLFLVVVIIVSIVFTGKKNNKLTPQQVKAAVSKHMLLPTNEEPTLAEVTDSKSIADPFIASKAQNGDDILIYSVNKLVIIYRPSIQKIVAAGDFIADPALVESDGATLTVLDGANNSEKTQQAIRKITTLYPKITIVKTSKANRQDFPYTLVIKGSSNKDNLANALVTALGAKNGVVPISESAEDSNLTIIVGQQ